MNKRGFLRAILAAGIAPAFVRSGILMPVRGIVIPTTEEVAAVTGNTLLSAQLITREALEILRNNLSFHASVNREWDDPESTPGASIVVRRPPRFTQSVA